MRLGRWASVAVGLAWSASQLAAQIRDVTGQDKTVVSIVVSVDGKIPRHRGTRDRGGSRRLPMENRDVLSVSGDYESRLESVCT
jgi:hypothetical protein